MTRRRFEIQKVYKLKELHFSSTECAGILLDFEVPLNVQAAFRKFFCRSARTLKSADRA
jgi:hypothetical protein